MNEREFLKKIRKLQESETKVELTDVKKLMTEGEDDAWVEMDPDNSDIEHVTPEEQKEEENKFKDIVSNLCEFDKIKVHDQNVEWSGYMIQEKIEWTFSLDEKIGCYIKTGKGGDTDFLQLIDENLEVLKKLRGYYDVWSDEWAKRLTGSSASEEETEF